MEYKIINNYVEVYVKSKGNIFTVLIDLEDLSLIKDKKISVLKTTKSITRYAKIYIDGKQQYLHRYLIKNTDMVDHINHNGLDNRKANLRPTTHSENMLNRRGATKNSSSGYRNVHKHKDGKWKVCVIKDKKQYRKRGFKTAEDANKYAINLRKELGIN